MGASVSARVSLHSDPLRPTRKRRGYTVARPSWTAGKHVALEPSLSMYSAHPDCPACRGGSPHSQTHGLARRRHDLRGYRWLIAVKETVRMVPAFITMQ